MRRTVVAACLCAAMGIASASALGAQANIASSDAQQASEITSAERLLFMQPHLSGVAPQTELDYAVNYSGPPEKVSDTVRVRVMSLGNDKNDAQVTDRTGQVEVPGGLPCNPVIVYFLEHDITEMQQLTGGQRRYFQNRVRMALAAGPAITPVSGESLGMSKHVNVRQIVIQPYLNDPNAARLSQYTGKRYTFVFSDDVPGHVLMIRTEVPGPGNDFSHPQQFETIVYQGAFKTPAGSPGKAGNAPSASR
ncbi:MAG TPA: hypothetical protein VL598_08590 [Trinickia sp.]|uniref:hypothetical protein n=1 Tax=Trinickia sp. TaxID=2571163 RepID=UPI002CF1433E|nr:hypothetical protein [Trinickia sp.]HTI17709.1 hypothetical protein [Trinickia sp.]